MKILNRVIHALENLWIFFLDKMTYRKNPLQYKRIPVIINNRNRYTMLSRLVEWLENNGYENIYIIDNDSTYPPLLEYYKHCRHKVIKLQNLGHLALWKSSLFKKIRWDYYVYTDADVLPVDECPHDVIGYFLSKLWQYKKLDKIGFSLAVDDLPDHYGLKRDVIEWERKHWEKAIAPGIYDAQIDTTFALYRPFTRPKNGHAWDMPAYRTDKPYMAWHLPWYQDTSNFTAEEIYYMRTASASASWTQLLQQADKGI